MKQEDNTPINHTAKKVALVFGFINVALYFFLTALFFISFHTLDKLFGHWTGVAIILYGSFIISIVTACCFKIVPKEKRGLTSLYYSVLLILNLFTFLLFYGLEHWAEGDTWLH